MAIQRQPRRLALTGGTGFVGRACLDRLLAADASEMGWEIWATTSGKVGAAGEAGPDGVRWRAADLLDTASRQAFLDQARPTHLLHLAWYSGPDIYRSPENRRWAAASLELLREFAGRGGQRAVFAGSCAEYEWGADPCSEQQTALVPRSVYGQAKCELGEEFRGFVEQQGADFSGAWARLFFLYGPHEKPPRLLPSIVEALWHGRPAPCSHGRQRRDYLSSLDAAAALVQLLGSDLQGAINVASGEAPEVRELILGAARLLGREDLVELGALALPADDPPRIVADVSRLREELGWQPRWSLAEGLQLTVDWWRSRLESEDEVRSSRS